MATRDSFGLHFTRAPDERDRQIIWTTARADVKRKTWIILSHEVTGHLVHFWGGGSYPCRSAGCPACADNNRARWEGWLACTNAQLTDRVIVGFPQLAGGIVDDYWRKVRTLRGHRIALWRAAPKKTARVFAELGSWTVPAESLPTAPNMPELLSRMWRIREVPVAVDVLTKPAILRPTGTDHGQLD